MTQAASYDPEILKKPIKLISGSTVTLEGLLAEKPVYLKFWASWCHPCREQMPHLQNTFETYGDQLHVLAINLDINDDTDSVNKTRKDFGLTMPMTIDKSGELAQAFNLAATPYHLLLTRQGKLVYKGHDVTKELDNRLGLLADTPSANLKAMTIDPAEPNMALADSLNKEDVVLFFTATWCDWYLKDSRPDMSKQCTIAQKAVNSLFKMFPDRNWMGIASRLWTKKSDLQDYLKRYSVNHDFIIDTSNEAFFNFQVKQIPTLLIIKNGVEQFRTSDFNDLKILAKRVDDK